MKKKNSGFSWNQAGRILPLSINTSPDTADTAPLQREPDPDPSRRYAAGGRNTRKPVPDGGGHELFENAPVGYFILGPRNEIIDVNRTGCRILQALKQDVVKERFTNLLDRKDVHSFNDFREQAGGNGGHITMETKLKTAGGSWVPVRFDAVRESDERLLLTVCDISRYKETEQELKRYGERLDQLVRDRTSVLIESEERYHALVDSLPDMVYSLDRKGKYTVTNHAVTGAMDRPAGEIIGKSLQELGFPNDVARKWNGLFREAIAGKTATGELCMPMPDGENHTYEVRLTPLKDSLGEITGCTGVHHDITEIKNAREALRQLSLRLLEAQEKERRAIGEVLHDELGASLTMLNLTIHQMKKALGPEGAGVIKEIEDIVREVIEQVRSLSHTLRPSVLGQVTLPEAIQMHCHRFETKTGIKIEFSCDGSNDRLPSEVETVIYRIVQESLTNAARHSGANTVRVVICIESDVCTVCIEDEGKGFDPRRIDSEGSGLSGMQDLASLVGGEFSIDSSPGYGTRITCRIPA